MIVLRMGRVGLGGWLDGGNIIVGVEGIRWDSVWDQVGERSLKSNESATKRRIK